MAKKNMKQTLTILDFGSGEVHQYHDLNYDKYEMDSTSLSEYISDIT